MSRPRVRVKMRVRVRARVRVRVRVRMRVSVRPVYLCLVFDLHLVFALSLCFRGMRATSSSEPRSLLTLTFRSEDAKAA